MAKVISPLAGLKVLKVHPPRHLHFKLPVAPLPPLIHCIPLSHFEVEPAASTRLIASYISLRAFGIPSPFADSRMARHVEHRLACSARPPQYYTQLVQIASTTRSWSRTKTSKS